MRIKIHKNDDVILLELEGQLAGSASSSLTKAVSGAVSPSVNRFIIDMEGVTFIDSRGLGALVTALREVQQFSGKIVVSSLNTQDRLLFKMVRLHRLFDVFPDKAQAMCSFDQPPGKSRRFRPKKLFAGINKRSLSSLRPTKV